VVLLVTHGGEDGIVGDTRWGGLYCWWHTPGGLYC